MGWLNDDSLKESMGQTLTVNLIGNIVIILYQCQRITYKLLLFGHHNLIRNTTQTALISTFKIRFLGSYLYYKNRGLEPRQR